MILPSLSACVMADGGYNKLTGNSEGDVFLLLVQQQVHNLVQVQQIKHLPKTRKVMTSKGSDLRSDLRSDPVLFCFLFKGFKDFLLTIWRD